MVAGDTSSSQNFAYSDAFYVDEHHLRCTSPPYPGTFTAVLANASFTEAYVVVSEYDGQFRGVSEMRYKYYKRPEIKEIYPYE